MLWRNYKSVLAVAFVLVALVVPATAQAAPDISMYSGVGAWIDIYDTWYWEHPTSTAAFLKKKGVKTLYLESGNYGMRKPLFRPAAMGRLIEACHAKDIKVVAWYLPDFVHPRTDLRRSLAAITFRTRHGQKFDSFGLDIESSRVKKVPVRNKRLKWMSNRIRAKVGANYPTSAIIPAPRAMQLHQSYWPRFPWANLRTNYDVFIPMAYYSYHYTKPAKITDYTNRNIELIRTKTGDPLVPIHAAGGIADASSRAQTRAFVRAVRTHGIMGASLYDVATSQSGDWAELTRVPVNPVQNPTMPFAFGFVGAFGNITAGDVTHPKEIWLKTNALVGTATLHVDGFDVGAGEISVWVNWVKVGELPAGVAAGWSGVIDVALSDGVLNNSGANWIGFVAPGAFPTWNSWGVQSVTLTQP